MNLARTRAVHCWWRQVRELLALPLHGTLTTPIRRGKEKSYWGIRKSRGKSTVILGISMKQKCVVGWWAVHSDTAHRAKHFLLGFDNAGDLSRRSMMQQAFAQNLPAGYQRHDLRPLRERQTIEDAARVRLRQSCYHTVRSVSCRFHEGVLILDGRVPSYYLKQIAQTLVHRVPGVEELDNRLQVAASTSFDTG
jgi:hypothetical protein